MGWLWAGFVLGESERPGCLLGGWCFLDATVTSVDGGLGTRSSMLVKGCHAEHPKKSHVGAMGALAQVVAKVAPRALDTRPARAKAQSWYCREIHRVFLF